MKAGRHRTVDSRRTVLRVKMHDEAVEFNHATSIRLIPDKLAPTVP